MELAVQIHVEQLPEGVFLATSESLPGLVAQGRTAAEALDIARDVAGKLIEARREREDELDLPSASRRFTEVRDAVAAEATGAFNRELGARLAALEHGERVSPAEVRARLAARCKDFRASVGG